MCLSLKKKSLLSRAQQCELLKGVCVNPKDILCYVGALFLGCYLERMNLKESVLNCNCCLRSTVKVKNGKV